MNENINLTNIESADNLPDSVVTTAETNTTAQSEDNTGNLSDSNDEQYRSITIGNLTISSATPKSETSDKAQPKEDEESFRQALGHIHEQDRQPTQKMTVLGVLGGDFFTSQILRRQIWLILLIFVFVILYISNRYSYQKSLLEIDRLKKELQDIKYKALSTSSALTEKSRQSQVLELLKHNKDSVLKIADQPPFIINVPEENK